MTENSYYDRANTTASLADVMTTIRKKQGETFPVKVRFHDIGEDGRRICRIGLIRGVLDNGDEVYVDAATRDLFGEESQT